MPPQKGWIVRQKPAPRAPVRLFCFPCGGVGASPYRDWPTDLGPSIDVCALHPPGREQRRSEPSIADFAPYLDAVTEAVRPLLDRPFALFGHSVGALVAFELARRLRAEGLPAPIHLFASGRHAPQWIIEERAQDLSDPDFIALLRTLNGLPIAVLDNPELMDVMLPLLRTDCVLHESHVYRDEPKLDVPITALAGEDDPAVTDAQLAAWGAQTTRDFSVVRLPGDHFYLSTQRDALLRLIRSSVARDIRG
ncbi:MAG: thioesterase domain-containing protein [Byssovorax sp.]